MDDPSSLLILPLYTLISICEKVLFFNEKPLDKMRRFLRNRRFAPKGFDPYIIICFLQFSSQKAHRYIFICLGSYMLSVLSQLLSMERTSDSRQRTDASFSAVYNTQASRKLLGSYPLRSRIRLSLYCSVFLCRNSLSAVSFSDMSEAK